MQKTDAELVNAVLDGRKELFAELVKRYEKPVRAIALNVLGNYQCVADISQDAFVRAYEKLPSLRRPDAFGSWLMKIAKRFAVEQAKRRFWENRPNVDISEVVEKPNGQLDEDKQWLLAAVMKLPKTERQVVMLHYFGQNNVADVAKILGRSVGTVTKQLSRARLRLRKILERSKK
ncbi:MAG: sigma-70 family RNA polymerase sigma factor [Sedimentisphaerales bacterium]|nr:sigma-70 family RNA polymerase sigma factor [Sedimentisphaerales bacterium]